ncbi:tigger transposable element-derived protein 4-like [Zophobas morio]|uniref:tigger transposable element-derived protein 4-like n=1 Tax=Zophobas morio TaxID=2755281 RepID=UPI003082F89C
MEKQKRKALTLKDKYDIIQKIQSGVKQRDVSQEMNLIKSTVSMIWKQREAILSAYGQGNSTCKKMRKSKHHEMDQGLLKWFTQKRQENVPVSGIILQEKANEMGSKIENKDFKCSKSWIERFKRRHNIRTGKIVGESAAVDLNVVNDWLTNVWPHIRKNYDSEDIFNADETGLFYQMTPDKTLKFVGESCAGGKLSKLRITVLVAANMSGTEKRKLLVIGKSANPRCFKNKQLPVKYKSNRNAWMTSEIFTNELLEWDEQLKQKNRKIVLLVDNCTAHPEIKLNQIKLVFMPPNTSSKLQPMDQGVIHSLKSHYRKILLAQMIEAMDNGKTFSVSILDAVNFIHMAWQKVSKDTIANCFKHGGFSEKSAEFDADDELPLTEWLKKHEDDPGLIFTDVDNAIEIAVQEKIGEFNFEEYVEIDNDITVTERLTDEQIIESVTSVMATSDEAEGEENESDEDVDVYVPSLNEMAQKMAETRNFLESRTVPEPIWNSFCNLERYISDIHFSNRYRCYCRFSKVNASASSGESPAWRIIFGSALTCLKPPPKREWRRKVAAPRPQCFYNQLQPPEPGLTTSTVTKSSLTGNDDHRSHFCSSARIS